MFVYWFLILLSNITSVRFSIFIWITWETCLPISQMLTCFPKWQDFHKAETKALTASPYVAGVSRLLRVSEAVKVGSEEAVCQLDLSLSAHGLLKVLKWSWHRWHVSMTCVASVGRHRSAASGCCTVWELKHRSWSYVPLFRCDGQDV